VPETRPEHIPSSDELTSARTGNFFIRDGVLLPTEDFMSNIDGCRLRLKGTYMVQEGVRTIGHGVFRNCTNLQAVLLPESITKIEPLAFAGCSSLIRLMKATGDISQAIIAIPYTVESIGYKAFIGCSQISHVDLGSKITHIAPQAFEDCVRLHKVENCNSLGSIERAVFRGCDELQELAGLRSDCTIGPYAFTGCAHIQTSMDFDPVFDYAEPDYEGPASHQNKQRPTSATPPKQGKKSHAETMIIIHGLTQGHVGASKVLVAINGVDAGEVAKGGKMTVRLSRTSNVAFYCDGYVAEIVAPYEKTTEVQLGWDNRFPKRLLVTDASGVKTASKPFQPSSIHQVISEVKSGDFFPSAVQGMIDNISSARKDRDKR